MVDMDYIEQEVLTNNNNIYSPVDEQPIDYYNNNTGGGEEQETQMVFIDTIFIFFCIFTIIPAISRCLYAEYLKKNRQDTIQENPIDNLQ